MQSLAVALTWLLAIEIAVTMAVGLASWHRHGLLDRLQRGDLPGVDEMQSADDYVAATNGLFALLALTIFVILIVFLWRAAKNTELWQRAKPRRGAGWAIGSWFIPFANLVLPALVVHDVWKRSPSIDAYGYRHEDSAATVGWWWVTWIASSLIVRLAASWGGDPATAAELSTGDTIRAVGSAFSVVAALLLMNVVRRLATRQAELSRSGPVPVPGPSPELPGWWPNRV